MAISLRTLIGRILGALGLRNVARRLEVAIRSEAFRPADKTTVEAVQRCLKMADEAGLTRKGDYYEFGLYRGFTFWSAQQFMRTLGNESIRFVGFDSFQGLPKPRGVDTYRDDFVEGQFRAGYDYVRGKLNEHGVDWSRTLLIPGFFADSLTPECKKLHGLRRAAVVLVDCDLYESATQVLAFVDDLLLDGGFVIFDDWNAFDADDEKGERRAFREFLASRTHWSAEPLFAYGVHGQVFRMKLRPMANR